MSQVSFRLLGPLEVDSARGPVDLGPPKQRSVLAVLLIHANEVVSIDRMIDLVWGDDPPRTAEHSVQIYVSNLRRALSGGSKEDLIETRSPGYVLHTPPEAIDVLRWERQVREGLAAARTGDRAGGRYKLEEALEAWTGPPLIEFSYEEFAQGRIRSLEELRADALEGLAEIYLLEGERERARELCRKVIEADPLREGPRRLMMLTLYRSGRHADALREFGAYRRLLSEELGIEPSEVLRDLEERVLLQDPTLHDVASAPSSQNPYRGLRPFTEEDAHIYFGREALVAEILEKVRSGSGFVSIVGPSGSGKSSAVRAGVIPAIRSSGDAVVLLQPGASPLWELAGALDRSGLGSRADLLRRFETDAKTMKTIVTRPLVVVVDQFEELFTLSEPDVATRLGELLATGVRDPNCPLKVVVTLRADYYDRALSMPALADLFADSIASVRPMTPLEVERAVVEPAKGAGREVDPALLAQLVADMVAAPGALPLLQYTLFELFERSENGLDLAGYQAIGGIHGALARGAEELLALLDDQGRGLTEQIFMRLVQKGRAMSTSRPAPLRDVLDLEADRGVLQAVLEAFSSRRLLTLDRDASGTAVVEIAHEYLITEWPQLGQWLEVHADDLDRLAVLTTAATEWRGESMSDDLLWRGDRLKRFVDWRHANSLLLTKGESEFLEASLALRLREETAEAERAAKEGLLARRARRRLWAFGAAVSALAAASTVLAITLAPDPLPDAVVWFDGRGDASFGDLIGAGVDRATADLGVDIAEVNIEIGGQEELEELEELIRRGTPLAIVQAFDADQPFLRELIANYEETTFVVLDCTAVMDPFPANASCVTVRNIELGYLAGVVAALTTDTHRVGFVGGLDAPIIHGFQAGFEQGVNFVSSSVAVDAIYLSGWNGLFSDLSGFGSPTLADIATSHLISKGSDVVFHAAGFSGFGVFRAVGRAAEGGGEVWSIGVDVDQHQALSELGESWGLDADAIALDQDRILASVLKRLDVGLYQAVREFVETGLVGDIELTLGNGGIGYTTTGGHLDDRIEEIEAAIKALRDGVVTLDAADRSESRLLSDVFSEALR